MSGFFTAHTGNKTWSTQLLMTLLFPINTTPNCKAQVTKKHIHMTQQCTTLSTAHTGGIKCTYTWQWMRNEREKKVICQFHGC